MRVRREISNKCPFMSSLVLKLLGTKVNKLDCPRYGGGRMPEEF